MAERHQRGADARLDPEKDSEERTRGGEQAQRPGRRPADLVAVDDRVHGQHQRGGHRHRAGDVEARLALEAAATRDQSERQRDDGDADREVDEEDPVPAEHVGEDAAEQHAEAAATRGHEPEDAHRLRALGRLREERHHQRERDRRDDRGAESLDGPRADQELLRLCQPARERGEREEDDSSQEQPAVSEEVAEPAAEQQEPAERQQVRVHDPCQRGVRESEVRLDRRKRDADDRHVEHDHQVAQAEDEQCEPAVAAFQRHFRASSCIAVEE